MGRLDAAERPDFAPDWFDCWGEAFGPIRTVAGLPMVSARRALGPAGLRVLRGATNPHSINYDAPANVPLDADLPRMLLSRAAAVEFDYLAADAHLLHAARGWSTRHPVRIAPHALAPMADCSGSYDAWFSRRSKGVRQMLRRSEAAAARLALRFEHRSDDPTAGDLWQRMLALEQAGWKGREGSAILDQPDTQRFYTALARRAAAAGVLRIGLMWQDDRLIAYEFGIVGRRRLFLLKVAYDEEHAYLSPGYLLAAWMIRRCCEDPAIDAYDKMGNGMTPAPYKLRFADRCEPLHRVTLYARSPAGLALWAHDTARARVKAWRDARRGR